MSIKKRIENLQKQKEKAIISFETVVVLAVGIYEISQTISFSKDLQAEFHYSFHKHCKE